MPLENNPGVGTGGAGLGVSSATAGGGLGISTASGGTGLGASTPTGGTGLGANVLAGTENGAICSGDTGEECVGETPTIVSLSPSTVDANNGDFVLTVNGTGFRPDSTVSFNGTNRVTVFIDSTQLTVLILAADVDTAGTFNVIVTNPDPGCGPSGPEPFEVASMAVGLRFAINESYLPDRTGNSAIDDNFPGFRIQEAGSRAVYRIIAFQDGPPGDQGWGIQPLFCRFSPDGTKFAIVWDFPTDNDYHFEVRDLGETLTSAGAQPGTEVYLLNAPIINDGVYAYGAKLWTDCWVNNDGDFSAFEAEEVPSPDIFDPFWVGFKMDPNAVWGGNIGGGDIPIQIIVYMDSRGTNTTTKTFRIDIHCAFGVGGITLTANPNETWWSATPSPASAVDGSDIFIPGQHVEFDITVDKTGLPDGAYWDTATDLTTMTWAGCGIVGSQPRIMPDGTEVDNILGQTDPDHPLVGIQLVVRTPTEETWRIIKQPVGGSFSTQSELALVTNLYQPQGFDSDSALLDADNGLIHLNSPPVPVTGAWCPTAIDLDAGLSGLIINQNLNSTVSYDGDAHHLTSNMGGRGVRVFRADRIFDPGSSDYDDWRLCLATSFEEELGILEVTNEPSEVLPETLAVWPDSTDKSGHFLLTGAQTGYMVGWWADNTVRRVVAGPSDGTVTVEALPGVLNISPGEADPTTVRALASELAYIAGTFDPRPLIMQVGGGGIAPEEIP